MKHISKFNNYSIINEEASGLAEPTLGLSELLVEETEVKFREFLNSGQTKSKVEEIYDLSASKILFDETWVKFPVSKVKVVYNFNKISPEKFKLKYPISHKLKNWVSTGSCENLDQKNLKDPIDDRTDHSIYLVFEIGGLITDDFEDMESFLVECESTVLHELNHAYEGYSRLMNGKGQVSTDLTYGLDVNRSRIRKEIFTEWANVVGLYLYWSEKHEMNAMVQEAWSYVKRYEPSEMMKRCPTWKYTTEMREFNPAEYKKKLCGIINKFYPDVNPEIIIKRLKNGLANWLDVARESSSKMLEDSPSMSGSQIRKMSVDKFFEFMGQRSRTSAEKVQKKILNLYSLKNNKINEKN